MAAKKGQQGAGLSERELTALQEKLLKRGFKSRGDRLPIQKWEVGKVVEGVFLKMKKLPDRGDKKGGHIFYLEIGGVRECYGAPAILTGMLEEIGAGESVVIACVGKVPSSRGQDAWDFRVFGE